MDTTSNRLKQVMEELDINQSELVRRTGINKGALSSYISGRYIPKQRAIYALASALDVSEPWLMGYDVPKIELKIATHHSPQTKKNSWIYIVFWTTKANTQWIQSRKWNTKELRRIISNLGM